MTRMTGPDCAVMCNLISTEREREREREKERRECIPFVASDQRFS